LGLTGVSYRFGNVCHINHKDSIQDFWGPLLAFSAAALLLQFFTLGYCVKVYLRNLVDEKPTTDTSSQLPSYSGSIRTAQTARTAYKHVKKVIQLQWRGVAVVLLVIADVVFFAVIFVTMDNSSQIDPARIKKTLPWLTCLVLSGGQKNECLPQATGLVESESVVMAVLIMLGVSVPPRPPPGSTVRISRSDRPLGTDHWILEYGIPWQMVYGTWVDRPIQETADVSSRIRVC
jgi:hypothetical protein